MFGQYLPGDLAHRGYSFCATGGTVGFRHRRHLWNSDPGIGHLHLPVHPVRFLPRTRRHDPSVQQRRAGFRRPRPGWSGQGGGDLLRLHGHDLRLRRGQRAHHRTIHHSPDEALRLYPGICRRRRSHLIDGRTDHAAGDGRGGLHHGRNPQRALCRHCQGGRHPGLVVLLHRLRHGASGGRPTETPRHTQGSVSEPMACDQGQLVSGVAAGSLGRDVVRRVYPDVRRDDGTGIDRHPDPRREHRRAHIADGFSRRVLVSRWGWERHHSPNGASSR